MAEETPDFKPKKLFFDESGDRKNEIEKMNEHILSLQNQNWAFRKQMLDMRYEMLEM